MIYGISAVMGIAAVLFSRDLFVETIGLIVAASTFIYIYITDSSTQRLGIEAIDIAAEEEE